MQKLLLLVCLQTSMLLEGQVKENDYTQTANIGDLFLKPDENAFKPKLNSWKPGDNQSKTFQRSASQWRPGQKILGKKQVKVTLPKINEFSYRSDREDEAELKVQKVTNKKTKKD